MDRNDQIFFSALGFSLAIIILSLVIAMYGTSTTAPAWTQSILTAFAIIVAITIPLRAEAGRRELSYRIAEVTVASALRAWLRIAAEEIIENQQFTGTGGHDGQRKIEMPLFTAAVDQIAGMRPHHARDVLSFFERRERRQGTIYSAAFYGDDDDGLLEYYEQIAQLFWSVRRIYCEIARERGLDEFTNRPFELKAVRHAGDQAREYRESSGNEI
jgi:hypothetical protein